MRPHSGAALAVLLFAVRASAEDRKCPLIADLPTLVRCAQESSDPVVRIQREAAAARARRDGAGRYFRANPTLELGVGHRRSEGGATGIDRSIEIGQAFEIGGQRGARVAAADAELRAADAASAVAARDVALEVSAAAVQVVRARRAAVVVRENREAAEKLRDVGAARARQGVAAPLETDLTEAAGIQALRDERTANQELVSATAELAALVGQDVSLTPDAPMPGGGGVPASLGIAEQSAMARPEVIAARERGAAARARVDLLRRERVPDITFSVGYRHEEFADAIGARVSVPIPLFRRNDPEVAEEQARIAQAESAARQTELRALLSARAAWSSWQRAQTAAAAVTPELEERLRLDVQALQAAYQRGTMPLTQVLAALREAQAARRTLLDTKADAARAALDLLRAAGLPYCPAGGCQ